MTIHSSFNMPATPSRPCREKAPTTEGSTQAGNCTRPRACSDSDVETMAKRRISTSKNYQPKQNVFRSLESTPRRYTSALCPVNLLEQKERFLRFGITPQFIMRTSSEKLEKITSKDRGQIRFTYLSEAKVIIEAVKKKYGDGSAFIQEMFGSRIDEDNATDMMDQYLIENGLQGQMNVFWTPDLSCTAKMMWHGPCQRFNKPEARKYTLLMKSSSENNFLRDVGIICLANHEIGTHYFRMVNDGLQPWFSDRGRFQLKQMSCREFTSSEEGLATVNTVLQARSKLLFSSALLYYTACMAAQMTFHELFDHLEHYITDKEQRWKHVMRVKRGLRDASEQGGYGNDQCYFEGAVEILRNVDNIDFNLLYSGRVCLDELNRVRRLARMDCIKLPRFLKDMEKYKRMLRQIAIVNGLIPKPDRTKNSSKKPHPPSTKRPRGIARRHDDGHKGGGARGSGSKIKLLNTMAYSRRAVAAFRRGAGSLQERSETVTSSPPPGQSLPTPAPLPEITIVTEEDVICEPLSSPTDSSSRLSEVPETKLIRPRSLPNRLMLKSSSDKDLAEEKKKNSSDSFGLLDRNAKL